MSSPVSLRERAYAKLNLVLHVGRPRGDGLHPLCSLFASLDLADEVMLQPAGDQGPDRVDCPGVDGPNLTLAALAALRRRIQPGRVPAVWVVISKRIPVAAGLGGGSADAAAVLRLANRLAGEPLAVAELRELAMELGSDVPSQVEPVHALVQGAGSWSSRSDCPRWVWCWCPAHRGCRPARSTRSSTARTVEESGSIQTRFAAWRPPGPSGSRGPWRTIFSRQRWRFAPSWPGRSSGSGRRARWASR